MIGASSTKKPTKLCTLQKVGVTNSSCNTAKHTSNVVKEWFQTKKVSVLAWPSQSLDLNPIEHLWDEVQRRMGDRKFSNRDTLFAAIKKTWESIPVAIAEGTAPEHDAEEEEEKEEEDEEGGNEDEAAS
uniref:Tc1-like transposase DDE domain-containing protein n=1 Tax=Plectus sambesii TaxID=2011161 RepID=A0A914WS60_9BILA